MAMTLGRVGRDVSLGEVSSWDESADGMVSISGWVKGLSVSDASWLREQLLGLTDPRGERAVPVSVGYDDSRDGWYVVDSVDVSDLLGATEVRGDRRWSATLRRLGYREQPRYELHRFGSVWANNHGVVKSSYAGWTSLPSSAQAVDLGADASWTRWTRQTADGTAVAVYLGGGTTLYDTVVSSYVPIDDAYVGAARFEMDVSGSGDWRTVVGGDVRNLPVDRWRLSNGLVRVMWSTGGGLIMEAWRAASNAWEPVGVYSSTQTVFRLSPDTGLVASSSPVAVAVLRNDPVMTSIRLLLDFDNRTSRIQWDLSLRRGDRNVINVVKSRAIERWGISPSVEVSTVAALVVTSSASFRPVSNDAYTHRWVTSSPKTAVWNDASGTFRVSTSTNLFPFGLGVELTGSNATGADVASAVTYQFFVQATETQMIAGM
jgi:hypothetical protein